MSAKTPGQLNYEAFQAARWPHDPGTGWTHPAAAKARPAWEAAAQAVLNDAFPGLRREIAELRAERDGYRIALERIADGSRNRDGMMGCASRALAEHPGPEVIATAGTEHLAALIAEGGRHA